jgi:hypothetical protein
MKESFLKNVVVALRLMANAVLVMISSPGPIGAYYASLLENPTFSVIKFSMACAACEKGKQPWKCTHKLGEIPHWQSEESVEEAKSMLANDPVVAYRELMGGSIDESTRVFSKEHLAMIKKKPLVSTDKPPGHVFITVDPSGGGSSHYAICSSFYVKRSAVVSFSILFCVFLYNISRPNPWIRRHPLRSQHSEQLYQAGARVL